MLQLNDIDVVVFDVLGTLVDERGGLRTAIAETLPHTNSRQVQSLTENWQQFVADQQLAIAERRRAYADSEVIDAEAAVHVLAAAAAAGIAAPAGMAASAGVATSSATESTRLATASRRLPPWPDSVGELGRITARRPVLALSNAAPTTLLHLAAQTGMRWHHAVTAHDVAAYKPAPALYRRAVQVADRAPERILMIAAHAWDLRAARDAGMRTCYVERPVGDPPAPSDGFDLTFTDLAELVRSLG